MEQQQVKLNISLDKTEGVVCEVCGNQTFQEALIIRKASKFLTGTAQDAIVPIPTFSCTKCGHVNEEFLPQELKSKEEK
jgi:uncharacterized Zn finger protein